MCKGEKTITITANDLPYDKNSLACKAFKYAKDTLQLLADAAPDCDSWGVEVPLTDYNQILTELKKH